MEKCAVLHKSKSNYAYAYDEKTLHIKLKTKKDDVEKVRLIYGDPFDYSDVNIAGNLESTTAVWNTHVKEMKMIGSDGLFDFWFVTISPQWRRVRYAFLLEDNKETVLFGERKSVEIVKGEDVELHNQSNFFAFPFLNPIDVYKVPSWIKDTIWYQIFPERFENGDKSNDPKGTKEWGGSVKSGNDSFGGDLQGIIDRLDYLEELGINGIYLNPIFHASSNHKYDTIDYFKIDPQFGDENTLKELIEKCHERGIKVMLDIVFNHCGFHFKEFQDGIKNGVDSQYRDWFHIKKYPVITKQKENTVNKELNYDTFAFTPMMPKFNTENIQVRDMLLNVIKYWAENYKIDAWRLDVANEVDHDFWREFRRVANSINEDCFILGEIWHDATPWLYGDQFHSVMNYPLTDAMIEYFAKGTMSTVEFTYAVNSANFNYKLNINQNMYNLLGSHDTARIKHMAGESIDKVKLAYLFMFTHAGTPSIYYGDEVGMSGGSDPDCRRCMLWDENEQDRDMFSFMKKLILIRKEHQVLSYEGYIEWIILDSCKDILIYKKERNSKSYYVLMNRTENAIEINLPDKLTNNKFINLLTDEVIETKTQLVINSFGYYLLLKK